MVFTIDHLKATDIKDWTVTALIYSGRPDPEWQLTESQQAAWMILWQHAPLCNQPAAQNSRLGYKGCRLRMNKNNHWLTGNGYVSFQDNKIILHKEDVAGKMENFLLQTAPDEVQELLRELHVIE